MSFVLTAVVPTDSKIGSVIVSPTKIIHGYEWNLVAKRLKDEIELYVEGVQFDGPSRCKVAIEFENEHAQSSDRMTEEQCCNSELKSRKNTFAINQLGEPSNLGYEMSVAIKIIFLDRCGWVYAPTDEQIIDKRNQTLDDLDGQIRQLKQRYEEKSDEKTKLNADKFFKQLHEYWEGSNSHESEIKIREDMEIESQKKMKLMDDLDKLASEIKRLRKIRRLEYKNGSLTARMEMLKVSESMENSGKQEVGNKQKNPQKLPQNEQQQPKKPIVLSPEDQKAYNSKLEQLQGNRENLRSRVNQCKEAGSHDAAHKLEVMLSVVEGKRQVDLKYLQDFEAWMIKNAAFLEGANAVKDYYLPTQQKVSDSEVSINKEIEHLKAELEVANRKVTEADTKAELLQHVVIDTEAMMHDLKEKLASNEALMEKLASKEAQVNNLIYNLKVVNDALEKKNDEFELLEYDLKKEKKLTVGIEKLQEAYKKRADENVQLFEKVEVLEEELKKKARKIEELEQQTEEVEDLKKRLAEAEAVIVKSEATRMKEELLKAIEIGMQVIDFNSEENNQVAKKQRDILRKLVGMDNDEPTASISQDPSDAVDDSNDEELDFLNDLYNTL